MSVLVVAIEMACVNEPPDAVVVAAIVIAAGESCVVDDVGGTLRLTFLFCGVGAGTFGGPGTATAAASTPLLKPDDDCVGGRRRVTRLAGANNPLESFSCTSCSSASFDSLMCCVAVAPTHL
jgi:hypothetical protein